ncbi:MAG: FixH family protein [Cyclobacteriaceae bacterium]
MKLNWGHYITIALLLFFAFIMYMVIGSFNQNIDLVSDDYYKQEIAYEDRIQQIKNQQEAKLSISAKASETGITINYPIANAQGKIQLYRPSEAKEDKFYKISGNEQFIAKKDLSKGRYILKIEWGDGVESYYQEIDLFVP